MWAMVPQNIKNCKYLQEFKRLIKVWKPDYWFLLIKHTPFIRFLVFHQYYFFFFLVGVNQTYLLFSVSYCIFKLTVNKVFNSVQLSESSRNNCGNVAICSRVAALQPATLLLTLGVTLFQGFLFSYILARSLDLKNASFTHIRLWFTKSRIRPCLSWEV